MNDPERVPNPQEWVDESLIAGVSKLVVVGIDLEWSRRAVELAEQFEPVFAVVGHHPTSAGFKIEDLKEFEAWWAHPKVVALGEMGFDHYWDYTSHEEQEAAFSAQLELAQSLNAPVVIHCRDAYDKLAIWTDRFPNVTYHFHCFGGELTDAQRYGLHHFYGVDGPLTYKKNDALRETIAALPKASIVLETDAPWLSPHPLRGQPNSPKNVPIIGMKLAEVWGLSWEETASQTSSNAQRLFPKLIGS